MGLKYHKFGRKPFQQGLKYFQILLADKIDLLIYKSKIYDTFGENQT